MKSLASLIDKLSKDILSTSKTNKLNIKEINKLFEPYSNSNLFLLIVKLESFIPVFVSENVTRYLNLTNEKLKNITIKDVQEHVNLESSNVFYSSLKHFCNNPNDYLEMCYQIKRNSKDLKWVYGLSKALTYQTDGQPDYVITLSLDVSTLVAENDLLKKTINSFEKIFEDDNLKYTINFTDREIELLKLISQGFSIGKIAQSLFISEHTVKTHRKNIMKKIGAKNGSELMRYAMLYSTKTPEI